MRILVRRFKVLDRSSETNVLVKGPETELSYRKKIFLVGEFRYHLYFPFSSVHGAHVLTRIIIITPFLSKDCHPLKGFTFEEPGKTYVSLCRLVLRLFLFIPKHSYSVYIIKLEPPQIPLK